MVTPNAADTKADIPNDSSLSKRPLISSAFEPSLNGSKSVTLIRTLTSILTRISTRILTVDLS